MHCAVTEQLFAIIRLLEEEKKKPKDYGSGVRLHHGEVMFLEVVARHPQENVSGISARLGITKGAVTQMTAKLLEKGLITTLRRGDNQKEKYLRLTDRGEATVRGHQDFHRQANRGICDYFATLSQEETDVIFRFMNQLKRCAPFCEFPCGCGKEDLEERNEEAEDETSATIAQCARIAGGAGERR